MRNRIITGLFITILLGSIAGAHADQPKEPPPSGEKDPKETKRVEKAKEKVRDAAKTLEKIYK